MRNLGFPADVPMLAAIPGPKRILLNLRRMLQRQVYKQVSRRREELEQEEVLQSGGKDSCIA